MNMLFITPQTKEKRIGWLLMVPAIVLPLLLPSDNLVLKGCYYLALVLATVFTFRPFLTESFQALQGNVVSFLWKSALMFVLAELATVLMNDIFLLLQLGGFAWGQNGPFFLSNYDMYWLRLLPQSHVVGILLLVLIIPVTQEILLRGLFFNTIYQRFPSLAIFLTTLAFALIHTLPYMGGCSADQIFVLFMQYVPTGLLLCFAYCMTESVFSPIVIHIAIKAYLIYFYL